MVTVGYLCLGQRRESRDLRRNSLPADRIWIGGCRWLLLDASAPLTAATDKYLRLLSVSWLKTQSQPRRRLITNGGGIWTLPSCYAHDALWYQSIFFWNLGRQTPTRSGVVDHPHHAPELDPGTRTVLRASLWCTRRPEFVVSAGYREDPRPRPSRVGNRNQEGL